jgi:sugar lactone lactonase YvrE
MRFNDGRCDRQGRFWAGTMVMDMAAARAEGRLYRYGQRPTACPRRWSTACWCRTAWPGRRTAARCTCPIRIRIASWCGPSITTPRRARLPDAVLFVDMNLHPGRPDGAAVDTDGCYWTCGNDAGLLLRFTPDGRLDRSIPVPMAKPSMCSFGGADLRTLLVTSISAGQPADDPWAGAVIALRPGAQGVAEVPFGG